MVINRKHQIFIFIFYQRPKLYDKYIYTCMREEYCWGKLIYMYICMYVLVTPYVHGLEKSLNYMYHIYHTDQKMARTEQQSKSPKAV